MVMTAQKGPSDSKTIPCPQGQIDNRVPVGGARPKQYRILERVDIGQAPPTWRLTTEAEAELDQTMPLLPICRDEIGTYVMDNPEDAELKVSALAASVHDSDRPRAKLQAIARAGNEAVKPRIDGLNGLRQIFAERCNNVSPFTRVPPDVPPDVWRLRNIPNLVPFLFWVVLFSVAIVAEVKNALYLVMSSGLDFEDNLVGAACFSSVYVLAPMVIFKFVESGLDVRGRKVFVKLIKMIGVPSALAGIYLFSWKIGQMQESVDLYADQAPNAEPPFWLIMATGMLLLAFCVMVIPSLMRDSLAAALSYELRANPEFSQAEHRVHEIDTMVAELKAIEIRTRSILDRLVSDRSLYIAQSLAELRRCRSELRAKQAQIHI